MEDSIVQLIMAVSALVSAVSGIVVYALSRVHASGKVGAVEDKIAEVATKLEKTSDVVTQHDVQLKTGVAVVKELIPEAQKIVDDNKAQIDAITARIAADTASLNELKKTLPVATSQPTTTTQ